MPTDDERREVARRLRGNAEAHPKMSLILNLAFADDSLKPDGSLALADEMDAYTKCDDERCGREMPPRVIHDFADRIREALGEGA